MEEYGIFCQKKFLFFPLSTVDSCTPALMIFFPILILMCHALLCFW